MWLKFFRKLYYNNSILQIKEIKMFYLYHTITASEPIASFPTIEEAKERGAAWFAGSGWVVRGTPTFNFWG